MNFIDFVQFVKTRCMYETIYEDSDSNLILVIRMLDAYAMANKMSEKRTWVGLTDEEIDQGLLRSDYAFKTAEAWRAGVVFAMTKLKEKNT